MTFASVCSLALTSEDPVVPTRTAGLDFMPVHIHGFVEKAASAFDPAKGTLSDAPTTLSQSALTIAKYLYLAHDIISILVLWMATAIRDIDANDDRSLAVITNAIVIAILEKFEMLSSGVHSSAIWFPGADTVD
jgi:hypothetical protein